LGQLVARRHDLDTAQRALSESRLLTFTGPGGVGKTRLALELAFRSGSRFPDGAWLVRLADLSIGAGVQEVESAVVDALGVSDQSATAPREKLLSFLGNRKLLVVLDNCEHVLSSVRATLPVMLAGAPQLRVIATSREPLGITREVTVSRETALSCEQLGERHARSYANWAAGVAHWRLGHLDEAERSARQVLKVDRSLADVIGVALTTDLLSWVANDRKQFGRARALSAAARHVWRSLGTSIEAFGPQLSQFAEHQAPQPGSPTADIDDAARFRDLDDVIDFVLGVGKDATQGGRANIAQPLTKRELEVAALVESGLSNREIAERLVIAKRTADGHVERILAKLGFSSRAQVAAWMARRVS
jgi:ATP/maltotriose-dependent transcriptional regulator MalT